MYRNTVIFFMPFSFLLLYRSILLFQHGWKEPLVVRGYALLREPRMSSKYGSSVLDSSRENNEPHHI